MLDAVLAFLGLLAGADPACRCFLPGPPCSGGGSGHQTAGQQGGGSGHQGTGQHAGGSAEHVDKHAKGGMKPAYTGGEDAALAAGAAGLIAAGAGLLGAARKRRDDEDDEGPEQEDGYTDQPE